MQTTIGMGKKLHRKDPCCLFGGTWGYLAMSMGSKHRHRPSSSASPFNSGYPTVGMGRKLRRMLSLPATRSGWVVSGAGHGMSFTPGRFYRRVGGTPHSVSTTCKDLAVCSDGREMGPLRTPRLSATRRKVRVSNIGNGEGLGGVQR